VAGGLGGLGERFGPNMVQQTYLDESSAKTNPSNSIYRARIVVSSQPHPKYWIWIRGPNLQACPPLSFGAYWLRTKNSFSIPYHTTNCVLFIHSPLPPKDPREWAGRPNADGGGVAIPLTRDVWDVRGARGQETEN